MRLNVTSIEFGGDSLYAGVLNNGINAGLYRFYQNKWVEIGLEDKDVLTIARLNNSTLLVGTSDGLYSFEEKNSFLQISWLSELHCKQYFNFK
ncbi:MAG: hypothetical protein JHC30_00010 [Caldisericum sp.]|jgi:hypothetical protein|nr:hypothetical protein [Caldisericum sp.]